MEAKHPIECTYPDKQPAHSAPFGGGRRARELEKHEVYNMLAMDVIEPPQKEWASLIVFASKKEETIQI